MTMDMKKRLARVFGATDGTTPEEASRISNVRFVRGRAQLSRAGTYKGPPEGHVISAQEALVNYGFDVLEEAVEYGTTLLLKEPNAAGNAIRRQRRSMGLSRQQVARFTGLDSATIEEIESSSGRDRATVQEIERVAFTLGLDEAQIAYQGLRGDTAIGARLKEMRSNKETTTLSPTSVLTFAEAASVIRVQHRLMKSLGVSSAQRREFKSDGYYGNLRNPAWRVGQELSEKARRILDLGYAPVKSMRELVEDTLCIPVIQVELAQRTIAGATISVTDGDETWRGIVLNLTGDNENPLVRRATIAHEIAHLLFDPEEYLNKIRVDTYDGIASDPRQDPDVSDTGHYRIEQRVNSFAISFLAPMNEVRNIARPPFPPKDVSQVVSKYGISVTAASYHVVNASYQKQDPPRDVPADSGEDWKGVENFAVDFFPIPGTPFTRRGRFATLVVRASRKGLISIESAAEYLCCSVDEFHLQSHRIA